MVETVVDTPRVFIGLSVGYEGAISKFYILTFLAIYAITLLCKTANYTHTCVL